MLLSAVYLYVCWKYGGKVDLPWGWMALLICLPNLLFVVDALLAGRDKRLQHFRRQHGLCLRCGYNLRGLKTRNRICPECGQHSL